MEPQPVAKTARADRPRQASASRRPVSEPYSGNNLEFLQRSMGNRALGMLLQTKLNAGPPGDQSGGLAEPAMRLPLPEAVATTANSNELRRKCRECEESEEDIHGPVQTKLVVGPPGDQYEREADHVAEQVLRMPAPGSLETSIGSNELRRKCQECGEKKEESHGRLATKGLSGSASQHGTQAPPIVHEVLRSHGRPLDAAARAFFEPRFGYNLGQVRVHTDSRAAESATGINARAYSVGNDLVFGMGEYAPDSEHGRRLLAHELVHTMQARGPERLRRFEAPEHKTIGDQATGGMLLNIGGEKPDERFEVTYGDVVALSGDYFDYATLTNFAKLPGNLGQKPGTRDEIIYAIYDFNSVIKSWVDPRFQPGGQWADYKFPNPAYGKEVRAKVTERFQKLAAANTLHFPAPRGRDAAGKPLPSPAGQGSSLGQYRTMHESSLSIAYKAGAATQTVNEALVVEAAAQHFLSDSFSAGHLRTPIGQIRDYWKGKYPLFWYNLLHKMALDTAVRMNDQDTNLTTILGTVNQMYNGILAEINKISATLPEVTLGDLVAKTFHDFDNERGLDVAGGRIFGDKSLSNPDPQNVTLKLAIEGVKAGNQDVQEAFRLGQTTPGLKDEDVFKQVRSTTGAPADSYVPETKVPLPAASNPAQNWMAPSFEVLWGLPIVTGSSATVGAQISAAMKPKAEIRQQLDDLALRFPVTDSHFTGDLHPRRAYVDGFVAPLAADPRKGILSIINWVPNYGLASGTRDDVSLATAQELQSKGMLTGMTFTARVNYIRELIDGWVTGAEEEMVVNVFATAPATERKLVYQAIEGHPWRGDWIHGLFKRNDRIWDALNRSRLARLKTIIGP
jgi:phage gpG-like protein